MRLAPLLALLAFAPVLRAQPDPTPPADYYPLEVGNEWVYFEFSVLFYGYTRRGVVREETVDQTRYSVEQHCTYDLRASHPLWACMSERLVRFDPATTSVVVRHAAGERVLFCDLGADFLARTSCENSFNGGYIDYQRPAVEIGGTVYAVSRVKGINTIADPPPPPFAAGIGPLEQTFFGSGQSRFSYARVRGVEYGRHPVADEGNPTDASFSLAASPNPTSGALHLALTLPEAQTVTAEAFDALGRRVWRARLALGAGPQTIPVDARAWAPGVYVVRAVAGEARATVRVVRR